MLAGAWGVHVPSAKAHFELTETALSGLLLAAAVGVVACLAFAGRAVARPGARGTARWAVCVAAAASA